MKAFLVKFMDLNLFFDFSREVAMATTFGQNWQNYLHSAGWRSKTNMAVPIQKYLTGISMTKIQ